MSQIPGGEFNRCTIPRLILEGSNEATQQFHEEGENMEPIEEGRRLWLEGMDKKREASDREGRKGLGKITERVKGSKRTEGNSQPISRKRRKYKLVGGDWGETDEGGKDTLNCLEGSLDTLEVAERHQNTQGGRQEREGQAICAHCGR